ncbi:hypothetical protein AAVH_05407 [Aphelenchoides avenae]|nr:hypothetical protein AAVH_05407 [Aphelenchus avenae]
MKPGNREEATRRMRKLEAKRKALETIHKKAHERQLASEERLSEIRRQHAELQAASTHVRKDFKHRKKDFEATRKKLRNSRAAAVKECENARTYADLVAAEHNKLISEMDSIEREFHVDKYEASTSTEEKIKSFGKSMQFSLEDTDDEMGNDGVEVPIEDGSVLDVDNVPSLSDPSADVQTVQTVLNSSDSASFLTHSMSSSAASLPLLHPTQLSSSATSRVAESAASTSNATTAATDASFRTGEKAFALISGTFFPAIVDSVRHNDIGMKLVDNNGEPSDAIKFACAKNVIPMTRFHRCMKLDARVWTNGCAYSRTVVIRKKPAESAPQVFVLEDTKTKEAFTAKWNTITFRWEYLSPDVLQALIERTEDDVHQDERLFRRDSSAPIC